MIYLNSEKSVYHDKPSNYKWIKKPYKGEIIGDYLIVADMVDLSVHDSAERHKLLCKCLRCGKVICRTLRYLTLMKADKCNCTATFEGFRFKRGKALRFLVSERNRLQRQDVFNEESERIAQFDEIIDFLRSDDIRSYCYLRRRIKNKTGTLKI